MVPLGPSPNVLCGEGKGVAALIVLKEKVELSSAIGEGSRSNQGWGLARMTDSDLASPLFNLSFLKTLLRTTEDIIQKQI